MKNRLHLDLVPAARRDVAVDEVLALGATVIADHRRPDGTGWVVVADPEGNELCVERSDLERGRPEPATGEDVDYPEGTQTAGEVEMLTAMLDVVTVAAVVRKVSGLDPVVASTSPVRSGTTIIGLVKHLALVEDVWYTHRFAGDPEPEPWASAPFDDDWDWDFHSAVDDQLDDVIELYRQACDRSRQAAVGHAPDEQAAQGRQPFTLRFAHLHVLEETARHLGHIDILREYRRHRRRVTVPRGDRLSRAGRGWRRP